MDTLFAHSVRAILDKTERSQKQLASEIFEAQETSALAAPTQKLDTILSKLSKLLNGVEEGEALHSTSARKSAFANALGVESDWVDERLSASKKRLTLILDPLLDPEITAQIIAKQDHELYAVATMEASTAADDDDQRLTQLAKRHPNPLIVLKEYGSNDFYRGAEIKTTTVKASPRGPVLSNAEELIPLDPPPSPRLFDEEGEPLYPSQEVASAVLARGRKGHYMRDLSEEEVRINEDREIGRVPSFPLEKVLSNLVSERFPDAFTDEKKKGFYEREGILPPSSLFEYRGDGFRQNETVFTLADLMDIMATQPNRTSTMVWFKEANLYAFGPNASQLNGLFAPHHPGCGAIEVDVASIFDGLQRRNPWRLAESEEWPGLLKDLTEKSGMSAESAFIEYLQHRSEPFTDLQHGEELAPSEISHHAELLSGKKEEQARSFLLELSKRKFSENSVRIILLLQAMHGASLVGHEGNGCNEVINVTADIGAGNLMTLIASKYEGEAEAFRAIEFSYDKYRTYHQRPFNSNFDGGDIRFRLMWSKCEALEGSIRMGRNRREEARLQAIKDLDDDFDD
ncbi:MAG: hypothetical protein GY822_01360 [Deltaproteobacteria bacterium]|nr:hypothetical protein [Deltaproteobacteria bacterium]